MPQFRAKARAIELLGKGQISDLPTAISELWKNGYDAYGDKLEAFLYLTGYEKLKNPFFVISDDGTGMTREDILDKWLILGTDAKTRNEGDKKGPETLGKEPRTKMGEKGIGRLSVAYLGSQMLMLTKKIGSPTQAVFFDWRILDNYNLFLADINIPIKSIHSVNEFEKIFDSLKGEYLSNLKFSDPEINVWEEQEKLRKDIIRECESLVLPEYFETEILSSLIGDSNDIHGTKFIIFNPDPQILLFNSTENAVAETSDDNALYYLRTSLNGLFNTFKDEAHLCETHIWIKSKEGTRDFISKGEFFAHTDFEKGDYLIKGQFNEYGMFNGKVRILEKEIKHKFFSHSKPKDKKTSYGPFNLTLGYVESRMETPLLSGEVRVAFDKKCELYGGLYIYRDGFRVLPYGRRDHDFLEFEERRSRGAGFYFFSHRRMFGYIEISREENEKLRDKASREGFINNVAYRDFTKDLRDFFIDLAKTYFREDATSTVRAEQKELLESAIESEKHEKEKEKNAKKEFSDVLKKMPSMLQKTKVQLSQLTDELDNKLSQPEVSYFEIKDLTQRIEDCKIKSEELVVKTPSRFKLTETQRKNLYDYNKDLQVFKRDTLAHCNSILDQAHERLKEQELLDEYKNRYNQYSRAIEDMFQEYADKLSAMSKNYEKGLSDEKRQFVADFLAKYNDLTPKDIKRSEVKHSLKLLEGLSIDIREKIASRIEPFINHLQKVNFDVNEDDLVGYHKIKFEEIEEEWNKTRELAQLGIAVEVIDHQFNVLYSQLSNTIESFSEYVKTNDNAKKHYNMMKNAFEHLENNYKLLQPLYRTTGRVRKEITGEELYDYVDLFFSNKLKESNIKFNITDAAKKIKIFSYESVFKPVLINIVNNAIYWMQTVNVRKILLDAKGEDLFIMNSGEPIEDYHIEDIFKLFYSQRPNGRGIGLYLAKTSLNGIGYDIEATNDPKYNKLNGACFIIKPSKKR